MDNNMKSRNAVLAFRQQNPIMKAVDIARGVGISRERVRQILNKYNLPTAIYKVPYICQDCGKILRNGNQNRKWCKECRTNHLKVELVCETCGKSFLREGWLYRKSQRRGYKHIWCSKQCQGYWLGFNFGRVSHRDNEPPWEV